MAELIVSRVLENLNSICNQKPEAAALRLLVGSRKEVLKLIGHFKAIKDVLEDAESKQLHKKDVKNWLTKVTDTAYDIDDQLDEWNTAIRKLQKPDESASFQYCIPMRKVCSFILSHMSCHWCVVGFNLSFKLRNLSKTLDAIAKEKDKFSFSKTPSVNEFSFSKTPSVNSDYIGKLIDELYKISDFKDEIINRLLRSDPSSERPTLRSDPSSERPTTLPIIPIVGPGGVGKTALAREVFSDDEVKNQFNKRIWVSASHMNEFWVAKAILDSLKDSVSDLVEMEDVLQYIKKSIRGKKFLLVLDDMSDESLNLSYWEQLKYCLKCGSQGSGILITSSSKNVEKNMATTKMIDLEKFPIEIDSWLLCRQFAFSGRTHEERKELEMIGRKIVDKCKNLPLTIKILGCLLSLRKTIQEWQEVLDSEIWNSEVEEIQNFIPLMLSYSDLPFAMKKCLCYCAVFPKNYEIEKDRLIKLWMAQGYLEVDEGSDMELIGDKYFKNLEIRSFFQDFQRNEFDGSIISCKMHDIVHDFVKFLAKNEYQLESSDENNRPSVLTSDRKSSKLRSLVVEPGWVFTNGIVLSKLFDQLTCLRALDLSNHDNVWCRVIKEVPGGIKKLIHLRYLNLSKNQHIKELPETLCELYNLQTLELRLCSKLKKLPQRMGKLINLRHLVNVGNSLSYMPRGIEKLTCLRTLSEFIVNGGSDDTKASKLQCIKNLKHLQGSLRIKKLGNVSKDEIREAELSNKNSLVHLYLSFEKNEEKGRTNEDDENALEDLQPPPNLEELEIFYYRGNRISLLRIAQLTRLRLISLDCCMNIKQLPRLGELPNLESLTIRNIKRLEEVGNEILGTQINSIGKAVSSFPKLKLLKFQKLNGWRVWKYSITWRPAETTKIMPSLLSLTIEDCPELETLPIDYIPPTLEELKIHSCTKLEKRYKEEIEKWKIKVVFD